MSKCRLMGEQVSGEHMSEVIVLGEQMSLLGEQVSFISLCGEQLSSEHMSVGEHLSSEHHAM